MCGKIRSLEEKSLPPGRHLCEMGAQAVPDARAGEMMAFYFRDDPMT